MNSFVITPDFTESMQTLPEGTYPLRVDNFEVKTSQAGNSYVNWKLRADNEQVIFHNTPIVGRGAGMFKQFIHALGEEAYEGGPIDLNSLKGKKLICDLVSERYVSASVDRTSLKVKAMRKYDSQVSQEEQLADIPF